MNLFKKNRVSDWLAVDLSGPKARLVHGRALGGKMEIVHVVHKPLKDETPGTFVQLLDECCRNFRLKQAQTLVVVPSHMFITKSVDIPSKDQEEIRKIIDLQSGRFTPYSREEIVLDYSCMETPEQHYTNVLLVIVNRAVIKRGYEICDQAGLDIEQVVVGSEGMGKAYQRVAESSGSPSVCGLHVAQNSAEITIVERAQMVFVRNIPIGLEQLRGDRETAERTLMEELNKSFAAFKDQGTGQTPKVMCLAGLIQELGFLEQAIQNSVPYIALNHVLIQRIEPSSFFQIGSEAKEMLASEPNVSFFDLMACLAFAPSLAINLVPKEIRMKRKFRQGGREVLTLGVLVLTIVLMLSMYLVTKIYLKKELIKRLDEYSNVSFEKSRTLEKMSTKTRALRDLLRKRGRGLYMFEKINSLIGDDIYLSSLSYNAEGNVAFSGTAISMSRIFAFVTELEESNYFKDVKATETKSRREGQKEVADFQIECTIAEGA